LTQAAFAVPGDLATPTGGYAYARRILAALAPDLAHLPLPGGFPAPSQAELAASREALDAVPADRPILIDGLAFGAFPKALAARYPGRLVALCHHPLGLESGLSPLERIRALECEAEALAEAHLVIATSQTTARTLEERLGVDPDKLRVAPPGVDPMPAARMTGEPPVILSVGSITRRKGVDVLLSALALLKELDWTCRIIGPDDRDLVFAGRIAGLIGAAGLTERVTIEGARPDHDVAAAFADADIFALATRYEGYGMVFAEALEAGLPTVGCDAGAVREVVGDAAFLAPPEDPAALAALLRPLIGNPAARREAAARARAHAARLPRWPYAAGIIAGALAETAEGLR